MSLVDSIIAFANTSGDALDTLRDAATALEDNSDEVTTLLAQQAARVAVNAEQNFTVAEKLQGCTNLGIGDPETVFLIMYQTARDS